MNVSEIIDLMIAISPSSDVTSSDLEKSNYLKFINLVCADIYAKTVFYNQRLIVKETIINYEWSNQFELSRNPVFVRDVYIPLLKNYSNRGKLFQRSLFDIIDEDPDLSRIGTPTHYYCQNNVIRLYPEPYESIILSGTVWYFPDFQKLSINSPETMIPIPPMFHYRIADGALYYLILEMGGFKNDRQKIEAKERWEEGRDDIISFIFNASGQSNSLSTYSNL